MPTVEKARNQALVFIFLSAISKLSLQSCTENQSASWV